MLYACSCGFSATTATEFYRHLAASKGTPWASTHQLVTARITEGSSSGGGAPPGAAGYASTTVPSGAASGGSPRAAAGRSTGSQIPLPPSSVNVDQGGLRRPGAGRTSSLSQQHQAVAPTASAEGAMGQGLKGPHGPTHRLQISPDGDVLSASTSARHAATTPEVSSHQQATSAAAGPRVSRTGAHAGDAANQPAAAPAQPGSNALRQRPGARPTSQPGGQQQQPSQQQHWAGGAQPHQQQQQKTAPGSRGGPRSEGAQHGSGAAHVVDAEEIELDLLGRTPAPARGSGPGQAPDGSHQHHQHHTQASSLWGMAATGGTGLLKLLTLGINPLVMLGYGTHLTDGQYNSSALPRSTGAGVTSVPPGGPSSAADGGANSSSSWGFPSFAGQGSYGLQQGAMTGYGTAGPAAVHTGGTAVVAAAVLHLEEALMWVHPWHSARLLGGGLYVLLCATQLTKGWERIQPSTAILLLGFLVLLWNTGRNLVLSLRHHTRHSHHHQLHQLHQQGQEHEHDHHHNHHHQQASGIRIEDVTAELENESQQKVLGQKAGRGSAADGLRIVTTTSSQAQAGGRGGDGSGQQDGSGALTARRRSGGGLSSTKDSATLSPTMLRAMDQELIVYERTHAALAAAASFAVPAAAAAAALAYRALSGRRLATSTLVAGVLWMGMVVGELQLLTQPQALALAYTACFTLPAAYMRSRHALDVVVEDVLRFMTRVMIRSERANLIVAAITTTVLMAVVPLALILRTSLALAAGFSVLVWGVLQPPRPSVPAAGGAQAVAAH